MEQDLVARTALDEMVESDRNQMLKAMIPYLPASGQQFLSMYAKTQELINTMTLFKNRKNYPDMQAASLSMSDPMEILQDIRRCCGGEKRRQIDQITNLIAVMQMIKIMNEILAVKVPSIVIGFVYCIFSSPPFYLIQEEIDYCCYLESAYIFLLFVYSR